MAPKTRAKSAQVGFKDPNPKQVIKLYINTRENDSKNNKRYGHYGASVRSEDTETALQDTADAAANVSAEPLDFIQPAETRESAAVLPEWEGRRRRTACLERFFYQYTYRQRSGLPTEDVELEVADFRKKWASVSVDVLVAATTLVQMKNDPNYSAPVQKESRRRRKLNRQGRRL